MCQVIKESPSAEAKFTNYFLAYGNGWKDQTMSLAKKGEFQSIREGVLELCHNWGTGGSCLVRPIRESETQADLYAL